LVLSPVLMASTIIVFIFKKLTTFYRKKECTLDIFDAGLLVGICSLFYFPGIILLGIVFIALAVFRGFYWREWLTSLLGFLTVYFLTGTYYFVVDQLPMFFQQHFSIVHSIGIDFAEPKILVLGGFSIIFLFFSAFSIQSNYLKSPIQIRNLFMLAGWSLFFLFCSVLFTSTLTLNHFLILNVPLSLIFTYLFMHIEKRWIADLVYMVYFAVIIYFQYFTV